MKLVKNLRTVAGRNDKSVIFVYSTIMYAISETIAIVRLHSRFDVAGPAVENEALEFLEIGVL